MGARGGGFGAGFTALEACGTPEGESVSSPGSLSLFAKARHICSILLFATIQVHPTAYTQKDGRGYVLKVEQHVKQASGQGSHFCFLFDKILEI
uniref:Secreted protein n=1 Tax=Panagrellus redivivus TaxID=6233 RepID=A0A7E4VI09_PANRE